MRHEPDAEGLVSPGCGGWVLMTKLADTNGRTSLIGRVGGRSSDRQRRPRWQTADVVEEDVVTGREGEEGDVS